MAAHALVVPYPGRGHLNPMLQLALNLASHGIPVTFVLTESWHNLLIQTDGDYFTHLPNFHAALIPNCVVEESRRAENFIEFLNSLTNMESHVAQLLTNLKTSGTPATCIVADLFLKWALPLAKTHALQSVLLCPLSVTTFSIQYHLYVESEEWKDYVARTPPLQLTVSPRPITEGLTECDSNLVYNIIRECVGNARKTDWIVANSFYALDCRAVEALRHKTPMYCVGPFLNTGNPSRLQMHCSEWLDSKPARSVIYVSFGSFMSVARAQIREIAAGLMKSGCFFLWALRPDKDASHFSEMLPSGYLEESKERGLIAGWLRQTEVLKHPAVGGFLSHCGWNAVMESVSAGIPMLGFPIGGDQFYNCRFVVEEWKFGLGLKDTEDGNRVIRGEEIEMKVRMLMEGGEGVKVRREAERFRDMAMAEVSKGGRSAINFEVLVKRLKGIS